MYDFKSVTPTIFLFDNEYNFISSKMYCLIFFSQWIFTLIFSNCILQWVVSRAEDEWTSPEFYPGSVRTNKFGPGIGSMLNLILGFGPDQFKTRKIPVQPEITRKRQINKNFFTLLRCLCSTLPPETFHTFIVHS